MEIIKYGEKFNAELALALGFFDSLHIGHQKILNEVKSQAKRLNCKSAIFTFVNNPFELIKKQQPQVYTFEERVKIIDELGLDVVVGAKFDDKFMSTSADDFLGCLVSNYNIKHISCGFDYKFGSKPQGDINKLKQFCDSKGICFSVIDEVEFEHKKASSTDIRAMLYEGDIIRANKCLGLPYRIYGVVERGYGIGHSLQFPTANIKIPNDKLLIPFGVYHTQIVLGGVLYNCISNIGMRPTFDDNNPKIETHIIGYNGDLYDKYITVFVVRKIRDTKRFDSSQQLSDQLKADMQSIFDTE